MSEEAQQKFQDWGIIFSVLRFLCPPPTLFSVYRLQGRTRKEAVDNSLAREISEFEDGLDHFFSILPG